MSRWLGTMRKKGKYFFEFINDHRIRKGILHALPFWIASLVTGLIAVGYTKLFSYTENYLHALIHWKIGILFFLTPFCFFAAWWLVHRFAPNARGSGIPQVMAAIELSGERNGSKVDLLLGFRIIVIKIASSLLMIFGGAAIGREGPTIQIAGSLFRIINKLIPKTWPRLSGQSFILTGAAAGLAAAFNTPLGGVVFAVEELSKIHLRYFRTALFSAVIIAGLTAQALLGPYLYLGYPDISNLRFSIFFGVALTAILSGFSGAAMSALILKCLKWKAKLKKNLQLILFLLVAGLLIATIACFVNEKVLGSGKQIMNQVLFTQNKYESFNTVIVRIMGSIVSFCTGAAGGVFAPSLAAGASIGAYLSSLFNIAGANANILILGGMVGFLTGVTRSPFTSAILVLEMTDRHNVIFHLMLAAMIANLAALIIDQHSLYHHLKQQYLAELESDDKTK